MDNLVGGLIGLVAIVVVVIVIAYILETLRRAWYWLGAKMFGCSGEEKFERENATQAGTAAILKVTFA